MNDDRPPQSTHSLCFSGFFSRYVAFFMLAGMCLAGGLLAIYLGIDRSSSAEFYSGIGVSCASLLFFIPVYLWLSRRARFVQVSDEGLIWKDQQGEQRCRWEEISEVYRLDRVVNQTFSEKKLTWVLANGAKVVADQTLSDFDRLADSVQAMTTAHLLAKKRSSLDAVGADFGKVVLARTGVTMNGKRFSWDEIEHSTLWNGSLHVFPKAYKGNDSEEAKLSEVPNWPVLMELLEELGQTPVPVEESILYKGHK